MNPWKPVSKGQSKLFINKVVKLLGLCLGDRRVLGVGKGDRA